MDGRLVVRVQIGEGVLVDGEAEFGRQVEESLGAWWSGIDTRLGEEGGVEERWRLFRGRVECHHVGVAFLRFDRGRGWKVVGWWTAFASKLDLTKIGV